MTSSPPHTAPHTAPLPPPHDDPAPPPHDAPRPRPDRGRWAALLAEPFVDEPEVDQGPRSTLPSRQGGLLVGLAALATVSWTCAAALGPGVDPRATVVVVIAALLLLLIAPSAVEPQEGLGSLEVGRRGAAAHYGASALLALAAWASLLWAPELSWAAMAAAAVLQSAHAAGVGILVVEAHLDRVAP